MKDGVGISFDEVNDTTALARFPDEAEEICRRRHHSCFF